jgi:CDP-diacylglycerol--glycerol-3-phosphate 3-phosphatidyltransferase
VFDGRWRSRVEQGVAPLGSSLGARRLKPDHLTALGLAMAVADAVIIATGHLFIGLLLLILSAVPDLLDGAVAKATGMASVRGAFFDSVTDRVTDSLILGGIAWHLATVGGRHAALLPFAVLATSTLISYERAKAESLGFSAKGGLMERAERFIMLGFCFIAGAVSPAAFVPALWVFFGLITATALGRFVRVWQEAEGPVRVPAGRPQRFGPGRTDARRRAARVDSRWRTWRETRAQRDATGVHFVQPQRADQPLGRWRARRQSVIASRSGRIWRARRAAPPRERAGRRPGAGGA